MKPGNLSLGKGARYSHNPRTGHHSHSGNIGETGDDCRTPKYARAVASGFPVAARSLSRGRRGVISFLAVGPSWLADFG